MALKALLLAFVMAAVCHAAEEVRADASARNLLLADDQSITVGYGTLTSVVALLLVGLAIAAVVALLGLGSQDATGYEEPATYASAPGPAAYERIYSVLNSLKEAARKYQ
ncbi:uncharacterized protein LOC122249143 [Penaeus japonicus]|uniref:uncharacterized protein LOC122249143 n=1 Tax=Penaeus japonicus TaxID=27405 RepID=UPI001C712FD1|nr:uncharacterized protein LOC122249143 [Penaeus japonicus]